MKKIFIPSLCLIALMGLISCSGLNGGNSSNETRLIDFRNKIDGNPTYHRSAEDTESPSVQIVSEPAEPVDESKLLNLTLEECKNILVFEPDDQGIKVTFNQPKKILDDIRAMKAGYDTLTLTYVDENGNYLTTQYLSSDYYNATYSDGWHEESKTWVYPLVAPNETIRLFAQIIAHKTGGEGYRYEAVYDVTAGNGGIGHVDSLEENWEKKSNLNIHTANAKKYVLKDVIPPEADQVNKHIVIYSDELKDLNWDTAKWQTQDFQEVSEEDSITYDITKSPFLMTMVIPEPYLFYQFSYQYRYDAYPDLIFETPAIRTKNIKNTYLSLSPNERSKLDSEIIPLQSNSTRENITQMAGLKDYLDYVFVAELEYTPSDDWNIFTFQYGPDTNLVNIGKKFTKDMEGGKYYFKVKVSDVYNSKWDSTKVVYGGLGSAVLKKAYLIKTEPLVVTLNPAGGEIEKETFDISAIGYNNTEEIPEPHKEGFFFDGWYLDEAYTSRYTGEISEEKTLYAKWSERINITEINYYEDVENNHYDVKFFDLQNYQTGTLVIKLKNTSQQNNHFMCPDFPILEGNCEPEDTLTLYCNIEALLDEIKDDRGFANLTIYASNSFTVVEAYVGVEKNYTVSFNTGSGYEMEPISAKFGTKISSLLVPESPDGLLFAGWYKDADFTQPVYDSDIVEDDVTLYAKWSERIELKDFECFENTENNIYFAVFDNLQNYKAGIIVIKVKNTAQYISNISCKEESFSCKPGEILTIYLTLEDALSFSIFADNPFNVVEAYVEAEKNYTVSFNTGSGYEMEPISAKIGTKISSLPVPESPDGLLFAGWYKDADFTQPVDDTYIVEGNVTFYAKWSDTVEIDILEFPEFNAHAFNIEAYKNVENAFLSIQLKNTSDSEANAYIKFVDVWSYKLLVTLEQAETKTVLINVSEFFSYKDTEEEKDVEVLGEYIEVEKVEILVIK